MQNQQKNYHCPGCNRIFNPVTDALDHTMEELEGGSHRIYCRLLEKTYRLTGVKEVPVEALSEDGIVFQFKKMQQQIEDLKTTINDRDNFQMILSRKLKEQDQKIERLTRLCNNIGSLVKAGARKE